MTSLIPYDFREMNPNVAIVCVCTFTLDMYKCNFFLFSFHYFNWIKNWTRNSWQAEWKIHFNNSTVNRWGIKIGFDQEIHPFESFSTKRHTHLQWNRSKIIIEMFHDRMLSSFEKYFFYICLNRAYLVWSLQNCCYFLFS